VQSNQIELTLAQQRVKDTVVVAPMDGVVSARNVQIGQIISSGISNVGGGTTVLVLSDLSRLYVLASVDESDIGKVEKGQRARITADAFPGTEFRGEVVRIATRGVNTSNVVTFEVKIEVLGPNKGLLRPEMTANVEIVAAEQPEALLVPAEALTRREGRRLAQVVRADGTLEERAVETGLGDGTQVEILSGLSEGETVGYRKGETESRWRSDGDDRQRRTAARTQRMMMGGGGGRRGRP
jgi:RND family efflux transporter MFP subunit